MICVVNVAAARSTDPHQPLPDSIRATCVTAVCTLQCHSAGVPGGAVEELSGHAGADAGRKGLPGDWIPAGEGE